LVECDRCHGKFSSYAALSQHYETKHHNAAKTPEIVKGVAAEKELEKYRATVHYAHGTSKTKLALFLLILIIAAGVIGYVALTPKEEAVKRVGIGSVAPDFTLPDINGGTFTLSAYRGRSNVLLFFNEGLRCSPCLSQMRDLDQLNQQFAQLNIVVVSITGDQVNTLASWARSGGPQYGKVLSDQSLTVSKAYDVLGADTSMMPGTAPGHTFFLVDKSGVIKWRADYGPSNMYVPNDQIITAVRRALGA
jgi:peroxiredoxin (alkyl hydroperoxide reductase subunit C)